MLRNVRILIAAVMFAAVTMLFLDFTGTLDDWFGWAAKLQFLPALLALNAVAIIVVAAITIIFGRIYCSVICPLGIMQDIIAHIGKRGKRKPYSYSPEKKWLRYPLLLVLVVAIALGLGSLTALLDPYGSYGRIAQNLLQPVYILANNGLAWIAEQVGSYAFYERDIWIRSSVTFTIAAFTFVVVAFLAWRNGRTYCNTICPVGTLLSLLARFSWFKIAIDESRCVKCGRCAANCKAACIDIPSYSVDHSRCVTCGNCVGLCHKHAISFRHTSGKGRAAVTTDRAAEQSNTREQHTTPTGQSRRNFLAGTLSLATTAVIAQEKKKVDGGLAVIKDKIAPERHTPITPPGSFSAENMARHCTGCQLCVAECPNDVLRPSSSLDHLMQPVMSYERGYCRPECTRCSSLCPTGAIRHIDKADKSSIQIGHAVWVKKNCVVVTDGVSCGNCARHCPVRAITMVKLDPNNEESLTIPAVNTERCIGCGACENLCPARPYSAIYVEGHETHRTV